MKRLMPLMALLVLVGVAGFVVYSTDQDPTGQATGQSSATALWSDWGDQMTADGLYFSGGAPCANGCAESFAAAWLSLAVKYYFVVCAGLTQAEGTAGYKQLVLRPNIPRPVRDPSRALNMVRSSMQTPHGAVESCWERGRDGGSGVEFAFRIPPNADATLVLPVIGLSNVSVALASESLTIFDRAAPQLSHVSVSLF